MLKYVMLATAMTVSVPALAQTAPMPAQTAPQSTTPQQTPTAPMDSATTTPAPAAPAQTDPMTATPSTGSDQTAQTSTTETAPAGVNDVVEKEFASYDKDANGQLSKTEFAAWMDALKAKSGDKAARDPKWNDKAFAQADADKSKSVNKVELTGFLSGAPASAS